MKYLYACNKFLLDILSSFEKKKNNSFKDIHTFSTRGRRQRDSAEHISHEREI